MNVWMCGCVDGWMDERKTVSAESHSSEESGTKRKNHVIMMKRTMGEKEHFGKSLMPKPCSGLW